MCVMSSRQAQFFTPEGCNVYSKEHLVHPAPFEGAVLKLTETHLECFRSFERRTASSWPTSYKHFHS